MALLRDMSAIWFTPEEYEDKDPKPRFKVRPLMSDTFADIALLASQGEGGEFTIPPQGLKTAVKYGLVDWENVGEEFSKKAVGSLPMDAYLAIATKVIEITSLQEEELKNS